MFKFVVELIVWTSAILLAYTYVGYPLLVWLVSRLSSRSVNLSEIELSVTVIITAYNEESDLRQKLENTLALEYPSSKLEVIVTSDCSTDRTDDIAREFAARVRLHRQAERLGKTAAQNSAVELAQGEILLFSDATTLYESNVIRALVRNFGDAGVGCVAGRLVYTDPAGSSVGRGARSYWNYETFIKQHESRAGSLIGVSGCMYAVRRSAYVPLYHEACSDFLIATKMVEQGLRAVYEPDAVCSELTNRRANRELWMRVRVITQTFTDLWRHRSMLNPFRSGFYAIQLLSHKVLRYMVPLFLIASFSGCLVLSLNSRIYAAVLAVQALLYGAALLGWLAEGFGVRLRVFALPQYFLLANVAALIACFKFARGERYARWEPMRDNSQTDNTHGGLARHSGGNVDG